MSESSSESSLSSGDDSLDLDAVDLDELADCILLSYLSFKVRKDSI